MGRFSTTVHIKCGAEKESFMVAFRETMKKRGYVPCEENEAVLTYLLAFGGDWVTLASEKYADDPRGAYEEAVRTAAELNAGGFSMEIVDSDFAVLTTFGCGADTVIVGDGSGYGIEDAPKGNRECWQPLLAEGAAWEKLFEAWDKNEVFVEDTLYRAAPLLGIEPKYMIADHRDLSESAESDGNTEELYFVGISGNN